MDRSRLSLVALEDRLTPVTLPPGFASSQFVGSLSQPTALEELPDGRFLIAQQGGALRVVSADGQSVSTAITLNVNSVGERGLLGVTHDPNFAANGFVYLYYTVPQGIATTLHNRVSRFTLNGNSIDAASEFILVDLEDLNAKLGDDTAVFMITNPNTLGLFETQIKTITDLVHAKGGLIYLDGANMNAILGITRPGDFGADMQHYNVHKTFTGPHGGGGPGSGPITVRDFLAPYLPAPIVRKDGERFYLDYKMPKSIGRVRSFFGTIGILFRGYCYIRTLGPDGLKQVSEHAVLNANYLRARVSEGYEVPHPGPCMHEFVASARNLIREKKVRAMDVAKRLLDYGFHSPTVYFPLVVPEALMMEPTETESKETLDAFADTLLKIKAEDGELVRTAPHTHVISRPDEVKAAKEPILRWAGK